jgi:hypothetical protein
MTIIKEKTMTHFDGHWSQELEEIIKRKKRIILFDRIILSVICIALCTGTAALLLTLFDGMCW